MPFPTEASLRKPRNTTDDARNPSGQRKHQESEGMIFKDSGCMKVTHEDLGFERDLQIE